ncbi:pyridoxamine 5'-phosphate oxidase [Spirosoma sordidisoli]|uniref:Pyridoxine/pyridoxamine 5'-phosphate oxidase n=1 Tax=Spirosoma sordidisoli TaxID=2502893 RepID=A0A4Q2UPD6_9BACT|nr:pyridoxamine 5'-phosphate oxidase [Spirosoma sordidisoli]RYC71587.1 pyridoxamine 5'-phosphate oxidase [Spirosoma sordidisoli]
MPSTISDLRKEYTLNGLDVDDVSSDPLTQFRLWFDAALGSGVPEPNAMHVSTITADGRPDGRIVLLKDISAGGFVFYTNYESRKGRDLTERPVAALTFFYPELERQIRIEGHVEKVSAAESDAYFASRPRGSQIGAWVSNQSSVITDRDTLEKRQQKLEAQFAGQPIPRPPHWGGFRVIPDQIEFWQGRPSRLHDRIRYRKDGQDWLIDRLSP